VSQHPSFVSRTLCGNPDSDQTGLQGASAPCSIGAVDTPWAVPAATSTFALGGASGTVPASVTTPVGSSITLPSSSGLSKTGSTFAGWLVNGVLYPAGASYPVTASTTLAASWVTPTTVTKTVTINKGGAHPSCDVYFAVNVSSVTASTKAALKVCATTLAHAGIKSVIVVGYADETGTLAYNVTLSQHRAATVAGLLKADLAAAGDHGVTVHVVGGGISKVSRVLANNRLVSVLS